MAVHFTTLFGWLIRVVSDAAADAANNAGRRFVFIYSKQPIH